MLLFNENFGGLGGLCPWSSVVEEIVLYVRDIIEILVNNDDIYDWKITERVVFIGELRNYDASKGVIDNVYACDIERKNL